LKIVIDTNVIVSALINTGGIPAKILSLVLSGKTIILYDNRIVFEYTDVLSREKFGFNPEVIDDMIDFLKHEGEYINAVHYGAKFHDETDKKFYEVYKSGRAHFLITGNKKHFPRDNKIIIPKDFLEIYDGVTSASGN